MTKLQLIFSIMNEIQGQVPTQDGLKTVHPQDIAIEVAKAYDTIVSTFFATPQASEGYDLDYFSKSYEERVKKSTAGQLYVTLPAKPLALASGSGIRFVRPKDSEVLISRISEAEFMNLRHLEAFCCSPVPFCYIDNDGQKIVLQGNRTEYSLLDYIVIKMVPKFTELGDDDEINTPGGDYPLSQMVLQIMGQRPTDNTNDDAK